MALARDRVQAERERCKKLGMILTYGLSCIFATSFIITICIIYGFTDAFPKL